MTEQESIDASAGEQTVPVECDAKAEADQIRTDIQQIDTILEEAEPYLAEALQALTFPEVYGLEDPESRGGALRKLRNEIEVVHERMNRARRLSSLAWAW